MNLIQKQIITGELVLRTYAGRHYIEKRDGSRYAPLTKAQFDRLNSIHN